MRIIRGVVGLSVVTIALAACGSEDVPSFIDSGHINKVVLVGNTSGHTSTATPSKDNLNELLNMLHLSGVAPGSRTRAAAPRSIGFTVVLYDRTRILLRVLIPNAEKVSVVYVEDRLNGNRSGSYALQHAIVTAELRGFIAKYPDFRTFSGRTIIFASSAGGKRRLLSFHAIV